MTILALVLLQPAVAQTFNVIYLFTGGGDGASPQAGVTVDVAGNLYCTASQGGAYNRGSVCKLTHQGSAWTFKNLYSFAARTDGSNSPRQSDHRPRR
ncbi:MAG: choice-of-anchor tandem repeat GloVer-containing protein [Candidatus Korobacteraceae bacterium]